MTTDPDEGIAADGTITTGAMRDRVAAIYEPVLREVVWRLEEILGDDLISVYLYGSVATGRAEVPRSDVDITVVIEDDAAREGLDALNEQLTSMYQGIARAVSVVPVSLRDVNAASDDGHAWRCFLKHYCVLLGGDDVSGQFALCQPTRQLALAFAGEFVRHVERHLATAKTAHDQRTRDDARVQAARRLLLAAAPLISIVAGEWTTDRARACELVADHYPEHAAAAEELLRAVLSDSARAVALETFESFSDWLSTDLVPTVRDDE